jgi:hypothetical protein
MKMAVFWVVVPCSLVEVYDVSEVLAASIIGASSPKNPEDSHIQNWIILTSTLHEIVHAFLARNDWVGNPKATSVTTVTWGISS